MFLECSVIAIVLFIFGILGITLNRNNIIIIIMSIELMLLAISLFFIINTINLNNLSGQIFTLMILTVAAAESAIGLAILITYYRIRGSISVKSLNLLRG
jgi:NADH-quinone oxidoreductase subunit K